MIQTKLSHENGIKIKTTRTLTDIKSNTMHTGLKSMPFRAIYQSYRGLIELTGYSQNNYRLGNFRVNSNTIKTITNSAISGSQFYYWSKQEYSQNNHILSYIWRSALELTVIPSEQLPVQLYLAVSFVGSFNVSTM